MGKQRRRIETEQRLIDAAWSLVVEAGVQAVGVNAVAARAEADKVLIYRYFGGIEGLLEACGARADFWPTTDELFGGPGRPALALEPPAAARAIIANYLDGLRRRPATLAVLRSECVDRNPLTAALEGIREERSAELQAALVGAGLIRTEQQGVLFAVIGAAMNYLLIRGDLRTFGGLDIGSNEGWERAIDAMATAMLRAGS